MAHILVVDDEKNYGTVLEQLLEDAGHQVSYAANAFAALDILAEQDIALILSDLKMPGMGGVSFLKKQRESHGEVPFVLMTAYATVETALDAMKAGAFDYLLKPFQNQDILRVVDKALAFSRLQRENVVLRRQLQAGRAHSILGNSPGVKALIEEIAQVGPARTSVLIHGETGTGKELVARALHAASPRSKAPMVTINCAAFAEHLLESELFGHERGAFTGATERKRGLFEMASGGTLFLDEIGEFPLALQPKLLRVLQDRRFRRVGGVSELQCDVRVIAATHRDLEQMIGESLFRQDLYYRLNVVTLEVPSLRDRKEDIPLLALHFLKQFAQELGRDVRRLAPETLSLLEEHHWPGNVRELANVVERGVLFCKGSELGPENLPPTLQKEVRPETSAPSCSMPLQKPLPEVLDDLEKELVLAALTQTKGIQAQAADLLGISRSNFQYKLKKYGLL